MIRSAILVIAITAPLSTGAAGLAPPIEPMPPECVTLTPPEEIFPNAEWGQEYLISVNVAADWRRHQPREGFHFDWPDFPGLPNAPRPDVKPQPVPPVPLPGAGLLLASAISFGIGWKVRK